MNSFWEFLSGIRWQDFVDILLNSYIIFRLYVLLRGTTILYMLMGVALLWFFQRIAVSLGLIVTSWLSQGLTAVAALIVVIIFGGEIRAAFRGKGLKAVFWGFPKHNPPSSVEVIADAVFDMAQKHTGSLIVFPGKKSLKGVVQNGIIWNGEVSKEMIISIFWHNNPVHDGAAILDGNQITEVGTILPLSQRMDLPKYYGTRHRAAIGLSESSDALVVATSEERGVVIAAKEGEVKVMHKRSDLANRLREHLGISVNRPHFWAKERLLLTAAGVLSVLLVTGVWFSLTRGWNSLLITMETPIEYTNRDSRLEILSTSANTVRLHLSGSYILLKSLRPDQVRVQLNLEPAKPGQNVFSITRNQVSVPPGIILSKVEPSTVEMEIDLSVTRTLPVQADWKGELARDLLITDVKLSPQTVKVVGSSRELEKISTIYTQKIPLEDVDKSGTRSVPLALGRQISVATDTPRQVTVSYKVEPRK